MLCQMLSPQAGFMIHSLAQQQTLGSREYGVLGSLDFCKGWRFPKALGFK